MPTSVRVAIIAMSVLAGLLLLITALNLYVLEERVGRVVADQSMTRADAERAVLLLLAPYLVFGLIFALASWFLSRRKPWARWMGLAASAMVATFMVFSAFTAGGVTVFSLLLFVLSLAAVTSLAARTTTAWIPSLRSRG
jgi:uncharacterized membrane protein (DUF2068 family)